MMANDWIKMRMDLQSHPKIVRILSATKSDKFRVIGGLHAVWCLFDTHAEDGTLYGYTPETMDSAIGWQGFSGAMIAVDWLSWDGSETLSMPEFSEHNGKSAKRRAEDGKRKRVRRLSADCPQTVRKETGQDQDETRTREEKRREEDKDIREAKPRFLPKAELVALGVDPQIADDWLTARKAKLTRTALSRLVSEAGKCGYTVAQAVKLAAEKSWRGFEAEWVKQQPQQQSQHGLDQGGYPIDEFSGMAPEIAGAMRQRKIRLAALDAGK